mmetsp:Transcript_25450/g.37999  ORF Transcript_25450/g.37999 Transcript_25450/m.37999 type:complete len:112 (-) Transcript_25450:290-625(-)
MSQHTPEKTSKFRQPTKSFIRKEIGIGFLVSVIATICGAFIYMEFFSKYSFEETWKVVQEQKLYGTIIALSALPNIFVFFIFLKKKQDYRARGVLIGCILTALITFVLKFI